MCAFGKFDRGVCVGTVLGGTGWTVQMTVHHNRKHRETDEWKELFFYDLEEEKWFRLDPEEVEYAPPATSPFRFVPMGDSKPLLVPKSAVVGSRLMTPGGTMELKYLFDNTLMNLFKYKNWVLTSYDKYVTKVLQDDEEVLKNPPPPPPKEIPPPPENRGANSNPWLFVWGFGWLRKRVYNNKYLES